MQACLVSIYLSIYLSIYRNQIAETVARRYYKKVLQNSQENTYAEALSLSNLEAWNLLTLFTFFFLEHL